MDKKEWLAKLRNNKDYKDFSNDQWECCKMIFDLIGGDHHLQSKIKPYGLGIEYNTLSDFTTFDFNSLTLAVFMAHDRCIRLSIASAPRKMIKLCLWQRQGREGRYCERHPNLASAITAYRENYSLKDVL
jgi:hypothetical protein